MKISLQSLELMSDFVEMDTTTKFKVIFAIHHRITAKFILRSYNLRKENLFR